MFRLLKKVQLELLRDVSKYGFVIFNYYKKKLHLS